MLGYVYVMSNKAMPGLYKIGCTARHPSERASDLYTTGVPSPFIVEYCILIDNYSNIEKIVHNTLSSYNFNKEFFKCDLSKCILTIKQVASRYSKYSEEYCDQQIQARIEGREAQYLRELEEKRRREQIARAERVRREQQRAAAERAAWEKRERERQEQIKNIKSNDDGGCLIVAIIGIIGFISAIKTNSPWPLIIAGGIIYLILEEDNNNTSKK